jgi:hypothetical protein
MRGLVCACLIAVGSALVIPAAPVAQERTDLTDRGNDTRGYATWETVYTHRDLQAVLGAAVQSTSGEDMGHVVQVLVDQNGATRAAVIDFGGFLGVGSRKVVVDWAALHFAPENEPQRITLDLTRDQVKAAPEYRSGKPVVVLGAATIPGPEM